MSFNQGNQWRAGATIAPSVIVKVDTTADNRVVAAGAGDYGIGVSQRGQRLAPGTPGADTTIAAIVNENIDVYQIGEVAPVLYGATVTRGQWVKPDASGHAIPLTTLAGGGSTATEQFAIGYAIRSGASGNLGEVVICPNMISQ